MQLIMKERAFWMRVSQSTTTFWCTVLIMEWKTPSSGLPATDVKIGQLYSES